jgi:hypothetical protein
MTGALIAVGNIVDRIACTYRGGCRVDLNGVQGGMIGGTQFDASDAVLLNYTRTTFRCPLVQWFSRC